MADGLTVPFALAAGVTGVVAASGIVVTAGLAEIVAGAISMGLGGYLAARSEVAHYAKEYAREIRETHEIPNEEKAEVAQILHGYGVREPILTRVVNEITSDREQWVAFMMRNELGLERPDERAAPRSAALVGGGYVLGGIFPLAPYVFIAERARGAVLVDPVHVDRAARCSAWCARACSRRRCCSARCKRGSSARWPRAPRTAWRAWCRTAPPDAAPSKDASRMRGELVGGANGWGVAPDVLILRVESLLCIVAALCAAVYAICAAGDRSASAGSPWPG